MFKKNEIDNIDKIITKIENEKKFYINDNDRHILKEEMKEETFKYIRDLVIDYIEMNFEYIENKDDCIKNALSSLSSDFWEYIDENGYIDEIIYIYIYI